MVNNLFIKDQRIPNSDVAVDLMNKENINYNEVF